MLLEILGYITALLIGVLLGLIGGGGSVLTVPVLVYLFGIQPVLATAYSLFIVGSTSLAGVFTKYRQGLIHIKTAIVFGLPSIIAVFFTRKYLVPFIPDILTTIGNFVLTKSTALMLLFAVLMMFASLSMIRDKSGKQTDAPSIKHFNYTLILIEGLLVGVLTGLVGAGGGFLIIPALVLLTGLPMRQAVGTSLLIIAAKSLIGFSGDVINYVINWPFLLLISSIAIVGIFIGGWMNTKVHPDKLKKGFGWFILFMGIFIIIVELSKN